MLQALPKSYICSKWKLREKIIRWPAFFVILRRLVQEVFFSFFQNRSQGFSFLWVWLTKTLSAWNIVPAQSRTICTKMNRGSGIDILKLGCLQSDNMTTDSGPPEGSFFSSHNANNALDRNPPNMSEICDTPITNNHGGANSSTQ